MHPHSRIIGCFINEMRNYLFFLFINFSVFLTGSDRIPVRGMSQVKMIIQPVFGSTDCLPVAHTCFNLLDLPVYESREKMREKFLMAVENAQGFGLV